MSLLRLNARELAGMSDDELWSFPPQDCIVEFDPLEDGTPQELKTTVERTQFSAYMWRIIAEYPKTPTRIDQHIGDRVMSATIHQQLLEAVYWDCFHAYNGEVDKEYLWEMMYDAYNEYFNVYSSKPQVLACVPTICIEDLIEVVDQEDIAKAMDAMAKRGTSDSIEHAHKVAIDVLKDPIKLKGNPISVLVRSGLTSTNQVLQTLIAHGGITDLNSRYFAEPISSSFMSGLNTLYESMAESRTSTKARAYKEKPIQDSEYFNRRIQLISHRVLSFQGTLVEGVGGMKLPGNEHEGAVLYSDDCGTQRTVRWKVKKDDLWALDGVNFRRDGDQGRFRYFDSAKDKHLVGEVIHFRTPALCNHSGSVGVCKACYGEIAENIPADTNLGQMAAIEYGEQTTQLMLKIKHINFAMGAAPVILGAYEAEFLKVGPRARDISLKFDPRKYSNITLRIDSADASHLPEIYFTDVERLPTERISDVGMISMELVDKHGVFESVSLDMTIDEKKSHMTHALLQHVKDNGYVTTLDGHYRIDITGFDPSQPLFESPNRDDNILDNLNRCIGFISSSEEDAKSDKRTLVNCTTLDEALERFHELTSAKMRVNLAHLGIIIYAHMVRSSEDGDYRLPLPGNRIEFGRRHDAIWGNSLGSAFAYEYHSSELEKPRTYLNGLRMDSVMDSMVIPRNMKQRIRPASNRPEGI